MEDHKQLRHIVILALPNSTLLNISGPLEVFSKAIDNFNLIADTVNFSYVTHVVSTTKSKQVNTSSGLPIVTEGWYKKIDYPIDTLIISGRSKLPENILNQEVLNWVNEQSKIVRRICSVCSGTFILAEAGILVGKRATTHWQLCEKLAYLYPSIKVEVAPLFIKDGNVYTSAGITSGMDLALALIEEDLGKSFALQIARWMVLFLKRPGNQSQFSTPLEFIDIDYQPIQKVNEWALNNLDKDLSVERLAEYSSMSPRNFARVFVREMNTTPAKYVERIRMESACRYLVETQLSLDEIAILCGLKNSENMRRLFIRAMDTTPSQYRKSFNSALSIV